MGCREAGGQEAELERGPAGGRATSPATHTHKASSGLLPLANDQDHRDAPQPHLRPLNKASICLSSFPEESEIQPEKKAAGSAVTAGGGASVGRVSGLPHTSPIRPCKRPENRRQGVGPGPVSPALKEQVVMQSSVFLETEGVPCCSDARESNGRRGGKAPCLWFLSS